MKNIAEGERLLATTSEMNDLARTYQKDAHTLEINVQNSSWWMCSKPCVIIFSIAGAVLAILILIIYFSAGSSN